MTLAEQLAVLEQRVAALEKKMAALKESRPHKRTFSIRWHAPITIKKEEQ